MRNKIIENAIDSVVNASNTSSDFKLAFRQYVKNKFDDNAKESDLKRILTLIEDDEEETYRIVTSIRGNSIHGLISNESPIGRAIMGHKVGDRCTVRMENGIHYDVIIRNIENTGESADDQIKAY